MSTEKPSKTEEEYFTKRDRELLEKKRRELSHTATKEERQRHFMKCPKCGQDLATEEFHGVAIERCPDCNGIWLDSGEIDRLMTDKEPGLLARVFRDVSTSLGGSKPE